MARWEQQEKGEKTPTMENVSTRGSRRRSEKIEKIVVNMNLESSDLTGISICSGGRRKYICENIPVTSGKLGRGEKSLKSTTGKLLTSEKQNNSELLIHPNQGGRNNRKRSRESDDTAGLVEIKRLRGPSLGK